MIPEFLHETGLSGLIAVLGAVAVGGIMAVSAHFIFTAAVAMNERISDRPLGTRILSARILSGSRRPAMLFFLILGISMAYLLMTRLTHPTFDFANGHEQWTVRVWLITVIVQASFLGSRIVQESLRWYIENIAKRTGSDLDDKLLPMVRRIAPILVYAVGALMALDVVGISIAPMLAGLGIAGIAVGLALQPTLSNLFSGMFMVSEGELNEGDFIELDGGPSGFVVDVSWRSTKIRDRFNNLIMIPNSKMMESVMTNYVSESTAVTILVPCGVSYESDLEKVERVSLEVANGVRDDLEEAVDDFDPLVRFSDFGESNIDFNVIMQANDRLGSFVVKHELIKRLHSRFREEGIEINYPVRKLVGSPSEGVDGLSQGDGLEVGEPAEDRGK
ncbi:MAG: mechanosensitive ion channel family protein [Dehalococcoidia bacterium]|nr:mechanosensitive ion channel family protein [Dehalococcoidia bacterium]